MIICFPVNIMGGCMLGAGRHLLTEAVAGTYIPADTMIGEQSGRIQARAATLFPSQ